MARIKLHWLISTLLFVMLNSKGYCPMVFPQGAKTQSTPEYKIFLGGGSGWYYWICVANKKTLWTTWADKPFRMDKDTGKALVAFPAFLWVINKNGHVTKEFSLGSGHDPRVYFIKDSNFVYDSGQWTNPGTTVVHDASKFFTYLRNHRYFFVRSIEDFKLKFWGDEVTDGLPIYINNKYLDIIKIENYKACLKQYIVDYSQPGTHSRSRVEPQAYLIEKSLLNGSIVAVAKFEVPRNSNLFNNVLDVHSFAPPTVKWHRHSVEIENLFAFDNEDKGWISDPGKNYRCKVLTKAEVAKIFK